MEFIKETLNKVNLEENTLYDLIYNMVFFTLLKESEDDIKNGRVCTLEELKKDIDNWKREYANNHIKQSKNSA